MKIADEERNKGTGFVLRLKRGWDQQYPEKNHISKQNLRDNTERFKKELGMNDNREVTQNEVEQEVTTDNTNKWTNEMKVNLMKIEERERNRSGGFMERTKEA